MENHYSQIEGFPGYRVSRDGVVESCWNRQGRRGGMGDAWLPLKLIKNRCGYLGVNLHVGGQKKRRLVHQLVLESFVGPRPPGTVCCHNDGDPGNNRVANLRWDTPQANSDDILRHGRRKFGEEARSKLKEAEVLEIRRRHEEGTSMTRLGATYGVSQQMVSYIVKGLAWRHLLPTFDPLNPA
ncbi:HNH endonuclease [Tautonia plasticadhaerens]|jgi:HNH endonuclease|uniref:HNH nuclease domain-containing protein n=1 Tax=Tautonia plasticadhaerens TaxID=2527974 RepID=A0A518H3Z5_9BACT|nr:HNH endonuclease [Tautonia plasticadhaerens]QDV35575.1 hypothetical protein ElP_34790 [Tautonia plasticadhaerens]